MTKKHKSKVHTILKKRYQDKVSRYTNTRYYMDLEGKYKNFSGHNKFWEPYWEDNLDRVFLMREKICKKIITRYDEQKETYKVFWKTAKDKYGVKTKEISLYSEIEDTIYECCKDFAPRISRIRYEDILKPSHSSVVCDEELMIIVKKIISQSEKLNSLYRKSRIVDIGIRSIIGEICCKKFDMYNVPGNKMIKINLKLPSCDHLYVKIVNGNVEITFIEDIMEINDL